MADIRVDCNVTLDGFAGHYTYEEHSSIKTFFRHFHDNYEILFLTNVKGDYVIENHKYSLMPYDILLIKPTKYHYMLIKDNTPYGRFVMNVTPDFLPEELLNNAFSKGEFFHLGSSSPITHNFLKLIEYEKMFDRKDFIVMARALMTENLMLIAKMDNSESSDDYKYLDEFNTRVMKYIRDNLTSITSLDQMAAQLYVSKSTLYHSFKKAMKISIMQYVRNKKVLYAQNLIKSGIRPTKAYTMAGFEDYTTFYRSYKLFFGHSPGDNQVTSGSSERK